ncbi:hypothetical protein [Crucivirus-205]|nr:hypothetical protein [Crucivirus-204]QMW68709.1 hypothetical protein [Crucivirus-205]
MSLRQSISNFFWCRRPSGSTAIHNFTGRAFGASLGPFSISCSFSISSLISTFLNATTLLLVTIGTTLLTVRWISRCISSSSWFLWHHHYIHWHLWHHSITHLHFFWLSFYIFFRYKN